MAAIARWAVTAGGNQFSPPDGFPEGMQERDYNDAVREVMAQIRIWFGDPEYMQVNYLVAVPPALPVAATVTRQSGTVMRVAGVDLTTVYTAGRRVRVTGAGTQRGSVTSSAFTAGNTDITIAIDAADGGTIPGGSNQVEVYALRSVRDAAFGTIGTTVGTIPLNTSSGALGTAAYKDHGATSGLVALHTQSAALGAIAYATLGLARTYTASTGGDQSGIADNTEVVVTGLGNITIPGTPNGTKKYRVSGAIQWRSTGSGDSDVTVNVRVGTNGNLTDAAVLAQKGGASFAGNNIITTTQFGPIDITPAAATKVTIGYQNNNTAGAPTSVISLGTVAGQFSYLLIEEVLA